MSIRIDEVHCQYCGAPLVERYNAYNNLMLCCSNYPKCDTYMFLTQEENPGIPANSFLRFLRARGHLIFDIIHQAGITSKTRLYSIMADNIHKYGKYSHFRYFGVHDCIEGILFSIDYLSKNYHKIKSNHSLSKEQSKLFMLIANLDIDLDSEIYENNELLTVIKLIYKTDSFNPRKVSRRTGACTCYYPNKKRNKTIGDSFFFKNKSTIRTAVHSLTDSIYNSYAKLNGFPELTQ